jgi:hypothetical protein
MNEVLEVLWDYITVEGLINFHWPWPQVGGGGGGKKVEYQKH